MKINAELKKLKTTNCDLQSGRQMGLRRPTYAFTEHGVAMLAAMLRSDQAIAMSIARQYHAQTGAEAYSVLGTRRARRAVAKSRNRSRMVAKSPGGNVP
jgi:hypothetical protein